MREKWHSVQPHVMCLFFSPPKRFSISDTEDFISVQKLVHFYVQNPHKFFCGMNPDERMRQVLTPYVKPDLLDTALQLESASDV